VKEKAHSDLLRPPGYTCKSAEHGEMKENPALAQPKKVTGSVVVAWLAGETPAQNPAAQASKEDGRLTSHRQKHTRRRVPVDGRLVGSRPRVGLGLAPAGGVVAIIRLAAQAQGLSRMRWHYFGGGQRKRPPTQSRPKQRKLQDLEGIGSQNGLCCAELSLEESPATTEIPGLIKQQAVEPREPTQRRGVRVATGPASVRVARPSSGPAQPQSGTSRLPVRVGLGFAMEWRSIKACH
jgi:hypothetical protein